MNEKPQLHPQISPMTQILRQQRKHDEQKSFICGNLRNLRINQPWNYA
jgi:hypothetical protein